MNSLHLRHHDHGLPLYDLLVVEPGDDAQHDHQTDPADQQPAAQPLALRGLGEGLVEGAVVADVDHLVRQLVENQAGELAVAAVDEGVEDRVVEPA